MKKTNRMLTMLFIVLLNACSMGKSLTINDLIGKWEIVSVGGEKVESDKAFLEFFKENESLRLHGNAGCNLVNAEVLTKSEDAAALSFTEPAVTMMACPDMDTENKILDAIGRVARVKAGKSETQVLLLDKDGKTLLTLEKAAS